MLLGILIFDNEEQFEKAKLPIVVTLPGIFILESAIQFVKA